MKTLVSTLTLLFYFTYSTYAKVKVLKTELVMNHISKVRNNKFQIGFILHLSNGNKKSTQGLLDGKISWKKIKSKCNSSCKIDNGVLIVNHNELAKTKGLLKYEISLKFRGIDYLFKLEEQFPVLKSIEILNTEIAPYSENIVVMFGHFSDGSSCYLTEENKDWAFSYDKLKTIISPTSYSNKSMFRIKPTLKNSPKLVNIKLIYGKEITVEKDIPVNYKYTKESKFNGTNGDKGNSGGDGQDGGTGEHGGNGEIGWNGGHGQEPEPIYVLLAEVDSFYIIKVSNTTEEKKYILQKGGKIVLWNTGGAGGKGGSGGNGGKGGNSSESYDEGKGGKGGNGGKGGDGGDGGLIYIYHDIEPWKVDDVLSCYTYGGLSGIGGSGGNGGKNGIGDNPDHPLLGLLSLLARGTNSSGSTGSIGVEGSNGGVKTECMNDAEYREIMKAFGLFN